MSNYPKLSNYVSEIDQFLQAFDQNHPEKSLSQEKEIAKYARIYRLRDNPEPEKTSAKLWDEF